MAADNINALLARGIGPALMEGAHAGYFSSRASREADQEKRRLAVQPDVPAAMKGDTEAFGRVAANDPSAAVAISTALSRMSAADQARVKASADYAFRGANAVLQTDPKDQPAMYQRMLEEGRASGHDVSKLPPTWDASVPAILRYNRGLGQQANEFFKAQDDLQRKQTAPGKTGGGAGSAFDPPSWNKKGPGVVLPADQSSDAGPVGAPAGPMVADATPVAAPPMAAAAPPMAPPPQVAMAGPQPVGQGDGVPLPGVAPAGPQPGLQPMGHRDPQGQLVPALIDGKPVFRNPQTGELTTQGPAEGAALSSGAPGEMSPGGALPPVSRETLPPGVQVAQAGPPQRGSLPAGPPAAAPQGPARAAPTPAAPGAVVHEIPPGYEPVRQQGVPFVTKQGYIPLISQNGPPILLKPADQKPEKPAKRMVDVFGPDGKTLVGQRNPDTNEYHPITPQAQGSDNPQGLVGDDFIKTLPPDRAAQVKALYQGRMALSPRMQASPNGKQLMADLMNAYPDDYDSVLSGQRSATAKAFATGQEAKNVTALNTAIQHLGEVHRLGQDLNNFSEGFGPLNTLVNKSKNYAAAQSGDRRVTDFETAKHAVAEEVSRVFKGASLSDAEIRAWENNINSAMSPSQLQGQIDTITKLMEGRINALNEQYKKGMGAAAPDMQLITPQAQATLEHIHASPITQRSKGTTAPNAPVNPSAKPPPPAAPVPTGERGSLAMPRLSVEEAAKLRPGTPFIGLDGVPRVRH